MEMDLFADLTTLSPPKDRNSASSIKHNMAKTAVLTSGASENVRRASERITKGKLDGDNGDEHDDTDGDRSIDASSMDDSVSSMQCSADPSAFPGFQGRLNVQDAAGEREPSKQMRLASDLSSSRRQYDFRPDGVSISQLSQSTSYSQQHFTELFYDTQDDQEASEKKSPHRTATPLAALTVAADAEPRIFVTRDEEHKGVQRSSSESILISVDRELTKRKQASTKAAMVASSSKPSEAVWREHESAEPSDGEDFAHGPHFTRGIPTPPLAEAEDNDDEDNDHPTFTTSFTTRSSSESRSTSPVYNQFETSTEMENAETEPIFSNHDDDDDSKQEHTRRDSVDSFPDTQSLGDAEMDGDEEEYGGDVDMEAGETSTIGAHKEVNKVVKQPVEEDDGDDDDVEMPTQPSTSAETAETPVKTISPAQHTSPGRIALKKCEKVAPHALPTLTDSVQKSYEFPDSLSSSSCKCGTAVCQCAGALASGANHKLSSASRNLAFSFAMPDSQESQSQLLDSTPDIALMASKALHAISEADKLVAQAAALKSYEPISTTTVTRKNDIPKTPVASVTKKATKTTSDTASTGINSAESTPVRRKRKRAFVSPDAGMTNTPTTSGGNEATPARSKRISARSTPGSSRTPSKVSTPSVRTRAKILSPLPSNRVYLSRTKTIFKYKFEFCLTGFINKSEESMAAMIRGHGGKIADRQEDVIRKKTPKAVVISTPISSRKRKFIHAIACGIPVVHTEWLSACAKAGQVVPFDGFHIPSGFSFTTRKSECLPVQPLDIFAGLSFGIPYDVVHMSKTSAKDMGSLIAFVLKACGATRVIENLEPSRENLVDIVVSDEFTKTCESYRKRQEIPVKNFSWVTECMILQRFISSESELFQPQTYGDDDEEQTSKQVLAASAEIGDSDRTKLKLYTGELVLVDRSGNEFEHFMLFHVCEILRITIVREEVILEVGVLKRSPNSPGLSRVHSKILTIPASHVKRRVVAVSKEDFQALAYRDESIFYFEEVGENGDDDGDNEE